MMEDRWTMCVKKQSVSDSHAVFYPLWDLFHGQKPPCCCIEGWVDSPKRPPAKDNVLALVTPEVLIFQWLLLLLLVQGFPQGTITLTGVRLPHKTVCVCVCVYVHTRVEEQRRCKEDCTLKYCELLPRRCRCNTHMALPQARTTLTATAPHAVGVAPASCHALTSSSASRRRRRGWTPGRSSACWRGGCSVHLSWQHCRGRGEREGRRVWVECWQKGREWGSVWVLEREVGRGKGRDQYVVCGWSRECVCTYVASLQEGIQQAPTKQRLWLRTHICYMYHVSLWQSIMATYHYVQFKHPSSHILTQHFVRWRQETSKCFVGWWETSAAVFPSLTPPQHHHGNCVKQHSLGEVSVCLSHWAASERAIKCSSTELVLFEWNTHHHQNNNIHITAAYYSSILQQYITAVYYSSTLQRQHTIVQQCRTHTTINYYWITYTLE